jgi:hypothetical protein
VGRRCPAIEAHPASTRAASIVGTANFLNIILSKISHPRFAEKTSGRRAQDGVFAPWLASETILVYIHSNIEASPFY